MRYAQHAGALLAAVLVGCSTAAASPSGSIGESVPASAAPDTTVEPAATLQPPLSEDVLDLSSFGWQSVVPEFDPATQEPIGFWLAVGSLDSETASWFEPLTVSGWAFDAAAEPRPVVDGPASGRVLYVADDGTSSELLAVDVHGSLLPPIGTTPHVVFAARLAPDGESAFLVLLDRATGRDLGVFRVGLPGDGSIEQVMPPATVDQARDPGVIRLAAVERFIRTLRVSADGTEVARLACGEPFGQCVLDVLTVSNGLTRTYEDPGSSGDFVAIGDGVALGLNYCLADGSRCVTSGLDLTDGTEREYPGDPVALDEDGTLVLLQFPPPTVAAHGFSVVELDGSGARVVFQTDGGVRPIRQEGVDFEGVRLELPRGWTGVSLDTTGADGDRFAAAVRLRDGGWLRLALPTLSPIGGGHD